MRLLEGPVVTDAILGRFLAQYFLRHWYYYLVGIITVPECRALNSSQVASVTPGLVFTADCQ